MTKTDKVIPLTGNEERQIYQLASELVGRAQLAGKLGQSYGGNRDLYETLGYKKVPVFDDFYVIYKRQDVAKRIISAPVNGTWRLKPAIVENKDEETDFEKAWINFVKDKNPYHYIARADRISGIGQYGVLLIGFDDVKKSADAISEVFGAREVLYLRPYMQKNIQIATFVKDTNNARYGLPETYKLQTTVDGMTSTANQNLTVHWSRIIHIAEGLEENDVIGTPRLECVLNRLQDLDLLSGGSAEMFWRGAFPGYAFVADPEHMIKPQAMTDLKKEIENYVHDLTRYLRLSGMSVKDLSTQVADPSKHFELLISLVSAATGIPKRILLGSERGELASSQDKDNWAEQIEDRRLDYAEPMILRQFIDRLIWAKILPAPGEDGYTVEWPDLFALSEGEQATILKTKTEALATYANAPSAITIIPPDFYLSQFLGLTTKEIEHINKLAEEMAKLEETQVIEEEEEEIDEL
jgi:hypothetical protein